MMLQDIYPHSFHNQYTEKTDPLPESPVYVFRKANLLVVESKEDAILEDFDQSGEHGKISMPGKDVNEKGFYKERGRYLRLPKVKELGMEMEYTFLFTMDGSAFFLLSEDLSDEDIPQGYVFKNIRTMRAEAYGPQHRLFAAITAYQLANWYRGNKYCGICGKETHIDNKERALRCECGNVIYPRIVPAGTVTTATAAPAAAGLCIPRQSAPSNVPTAEGPSIPASFPLSSWALSTETRFF